LIKILHIFLINTDGTTTELTSGGPIKEILKTGECYVIVADDVRKVFLWKGVKSSVRSKFIGARRSQEIRGQVGMYHAVVPLDEGEEDPEFIKLIGGQTEAGIAKEIKAAEVSAPSGHPLREKNIFGTPRPAEGLGMNIVGSRDRQAQNIGPLYRGDGSMADLMQDQTQVDFQQMMQILEEIQIPSGFEREFIIIGNQAYSIIEKVQQFLGKKQIIKEFSRVGAIPEGIFFAENYSPRIITENGKIIAIEFLKYVNAVPYPLKDSVIELQEKVKKQHSTINELKRQIKDKKSESNHQLSETDLSNKDRILNLLKKKALTSNDIADKLGLSKQDTRTYLLRLRKENKVKTLGKKGRYYIYTSKKPLDTTILSFKDEISKKISELEVKVDTIASKPPKFREEEEFFDLQKGSIYRGIGEEIENFEPLSTQKIQPPYSQTLELPVEQLDGTLQTLLASVPELKAATIVSTEGKPIASALPQGVDESRIANMMVPLLSLAEKAINEMKQGEFEQLYVKGKEGYLLVLPAGPNAVLSVSTTKDPRLGLIFLDCKRTCEKIAKLI